MTSEEMEVCEARCELRTSKMRRQHLDDKVEFATLMSEMSEVLEDLVDTVIRQNARIEFLERMMISE